MNNRSCDLKNMRQKQKKESQKLKEFEKRTKKENKIFEQQVTRKWLNIFSLWHLEMRKTSRLIKYHALLDIRCWHA